MTLKKYKSKRNLKRSTEPSAKIHKRGQEKLHFVIQKHAATRLHYDFRLEVNGVLKSWAVPKGPSLNPKDKRLAIMVEDHPYGYKDFEGIIPEGYGAGSVLIWDQGTYSVEDKPAQESEKMITKGLAKGEIHFSLEGTKLKGEFALVRLNDEKNEWLLIKKKDSFASTKNVLDENTSVVSGTTLEEIGGMPKKKKFHDVKPMLATLIDEPFDNKEWLFEIKFDGFRAIAEVDKSNVLLYSRNFQPFNDRFPKIVESLKELHTDAIFDGEIVVLDKKGVSSFQLLQNSQREKTDKNLFYYIFDILYYQGHDLRKLPLIERKEILQKLLEKAPAPLRYTDHIEDKGVSFFKKATQNELEGIIGKKKNSHYQPSKRTKEWVKIKRILQQEVVICGFTEPRGGRKGLGALVTGIYKKGILTYAGHVGGGFSEKKLQEVKSLLFPLIQKKCPFETAPKTNTKVTWVKPHFLCEVAFSEWTNEGIMRHPVFLGIREDKAPKAVTKEKPVKKEKVLKSENKATFSNLEKVYWPKEGYTKGDTIHYYESVAPYLLPFLKDRPESLKRFPDGIHGNTFFQKNLQHYPEWIKTIEIPHKDKIVNYLLIQDLDSLLFAVNLGCIELHPFFSRYQKLEYPDFMVWDLDPEAISFDKVVETAQVLHAILEDLGIPSLCKTSGATGLHICTPLKAKYTYDQAKEFAQIIALMVHKEIPKFTSLERSPKNRQKKVYIDCFQNNQGQTIAAPYSLRAKEGAPVAAPLEWSEVVKGLNPLDFNIETMPIRLKETGDLFQPLLKKSFSMEKALKTSLSTYEF